MSKMAYHCKIVIEKLKQEFWQTIEGQFYFKKANIKNSNKLILKKYDWIKGHPWKYWWMLDFKTILHSLFATYVRDSTDQLDICSKQVPRCIIHAMQSILQKHC